MEMEWTGRRGLERLQIPSASTFWTAAQLATRPERVRAAQGTTNFNNIKKKINPKSAEKVRYISYIIQDTIHQIQAPLSQLTPWRLTCGRTMAVPMEA